MPNLVGTGLNQVPTNSMLGGLAYQNAQNTSIKNLNLKNISLINSEIADTAVDVFVYDTSKDSDGGAWRKKTSHISWYNETLNTATRGSRREFPSVAVIVAETNKVTIYDGDDPDLPMWMVFNGGVGSNAADTTFLGTINVPISSILMLNGVLCVGFSSTGGWGVSEIGFVSDSQRWWWTTGIYKQPLNSIDKRNVGSGYLAVDTSASVQLVNALVNDVAMTVLPNAPIDPSTGLPIPTIAVATDGGLSIIKDDGTVVNKTRGTNETHSIAFDEDNSLIFSWGTSDNFPRHLSRFEIADWIVSANISFTDNYFSGYNEGLGSGAASTGTAAGGFVTVANSGRHFGIDYGSGGNPDDRLGILHPKNLTNNANQNLSAFITSSYNTGWMYGDVKGAFLSDTDTTNVVGGGDGLITGNDSTFGAVITSLNWSERSGSGGAWNVSGGVLKTGTVSSGEYLDITTSGYTSGQRYVISYTLANVTGSNPLRIRINNGQVDNLPTSNGSHSHYITFTETGTLFSIINDSSLTADIDNFKLQLVQDEDRSVNNKGLAVYGTITKSAVATGAELVAYSGFSASNYLQQPYNSSLGLSSTDSVTIICWIKQASNNNSIEVIFGTGQMATGQGRYIYTNSGRPYLDTYGGVANNSTTVITDNIWHHLVAIYTPSGGFMYIDGTLDATPTYGSSAYASQSGSPQLGTRIGCERNGSLPTPAYVSLLRISNSVPSAEQIKKIYEDEKVLFQENAKATLYGSSDAVTALAYDEVTDQLHVGTSSGRSDFQGLRRINNTTTAVTTAISAHDTFIIEQ